MAEEKRHEMMETLFGAESGDSDEELEAGPISGAYSDEEAEPAPAGDAESEGERESEVDREEESEGAQGLSDDGDEVNQMRYTREAVGGEASEEDREEGSFEGGGEDSDEADEGGIVKKLEETPKPSFDGEEDSDEDREGGVGRSDPGRKVEGESEREDGSEERMEASDGGEASVNGSEHYEDDQEVEEDNEDANAGRETSFKQDIGEAVGIHDVFGDSDEDEVEGHDRQRPSPQDFVQHAPSDNEASDHGGLRPEDVVMDEEDRYDSEEEQQLERKSKEKPVGPPLNLVIPLQPPPARSEKMNLVKVSNIMDIEPRQFNPKTYVEEETFVTDEAGQKQRLRLEENVVRWRAVQNPDGSISYESNARFVKWSDGSMQLLIGNEVLDLSVQDAQQDQTHLFLRHPKSVLQSQGRLLHKMRFMPSSLTSKSHRLLTALVDSRHRKVYKVKNIVTTFDPEKDKEEKEKALEQRIRSREDLQRKQEKLNRKYLPAREREAQLSPGYLEGALEEEEERDEYNEGKKSLDMRRFQEQLEAEGRAERRIIDAKRQNRPAKDAPLRHPKERLPPSRSRHEVEDSFSEENEGEEEAEASEYESDQQKTEAGFNEEAEQEEYVVGGNEEDEEEELEEEEQEEEEEEEQEHEYRNKFQGSEERRYVEQDDENSKKRKERDREEDYSPEASPPKKAVQRRRVVVSDSEEE